MYFDELAINFVQTFSVQNSFQATEWIGMTFVSDIYGPLRMLRSKSGDSLTKMASLLV